MTFFITTFKVMKLKKNELKTITFSMEERIKEFDSFEDVCSPITDLIVERELNKQQFLPISDVIDENIIMLRSCVFNKDEYQTMTMYILNNTDEKIKKQIFKLIFNRSFDVCMCHMIRWTLPYLVDGDLKSMCSIIKSNEELNLSLRRSIEMFDYVFLYDMKYNTYQDKMNKLKIELQESSLVKQITNESQWKEHVAKQKIKLFTYLKMKRIMKALKKDENLVNKINTYCSNYENDETDSQKEFNRLLKFYSLTANKESCEKLCRSKMSDQSKFFVEECNKINSNLDLSPEEMHDEKPIYITQEFFDNVINLQELTYPRKIFLLSLPYSFYRGKIISTDKLKDNKKLIEGEKVVTIDEGRAEELFLEFPILPLIVKKKDGENTHFRELLERKNWKEDNKYFIVINELKKDNENVYLYIKILKMYLNYFIETENEIPYYFKEKFVPTFIDDIKKSKKGDLKYFKQILSLITWLCSKYSISNMLYEILKGIKNLPDNESLLDIFYFFTEEYIVLSSPSSNFLDDDWNFFSSLYETVKENKHLEKYPYVTFIKLAFNMRKSLMFYNEKNKKNERNEILTLYPVDCEREIIEYIEKDNGITEEHAKIYLLLILNYWLYLENEIGIPYRVSLDLFKIAKEQNYYDVKEMEKIIEDLSSESKGAVDMKGIFDIQIPTFPTDEKNFMKLLKNIIRIKYKTKGEYLNENILKSRINNFNDESCYYYTLEENYTCDTYRPTICSNDNKIETKLELITVNSQYSKYLENLERERTKIKSELDEFVYEKSCLIPKIIESNTMQIMNDLLRKIKMKKDKELTEKCNYIRKCDYNKNIRCLKFIFSRIKGIVSAIDGTWEEDQNTSESIDGFIIGCMAVNKTENISPLKSEDLLKLSTIVDEKKFRMLLILLMKYRFKGISISTLFDWTLKQNKNWGDKMRKLLFERIRCEQKTVQERVKMIKENTEISASEITKEKEIISETLRDIINVGSYEIELLEKKIDELKEDTYDNAIKQIIEKRIWEISKYRCEVFNQIFICMDVLQMEKSQINKIMLDILKYPANGIENIILNLKVASELQPETKLMCWWILVLKGKIDSDIQQFSIDRINRDSMKVFSKNINYAIESQIFTVEGECRKRDLQRIGVKGQKELKLLRELLQPECSYKATEMFNAVTK